MSEELAKYLDNYLSEKYAKPCIAMITGKNCKPCDEMKPKFERLTKENPNIKFLMVNVEQVNNLRLISKIGFNVEGVPAFAVYIKGRCMAHFIGNDEKQLNYLVNCLKGDTPRDHCKV